MNRKIKYYPDIDDPNFKDILYKKKEFYINKYSEKDEFKNYDDLKKARDIACQSSIFSSRELLQHQKFLKNYLLQDSIVDNQSKQIYNITVWK